MDELRWFLIIAGTVVIVAVVLYGRIDDWRRDGLPWSRRRRSERVPFQDDELSEDELQGTLDELDSLITEQRTEVDSPQRETARTSGTEHFPAGDEAADSLEAESPRAGRENVAGHTDAATPREARAADSDAETEAEAEAKAEAEADADAAPFGESGAESPESSSPPAPSAAEPPSRADAPRSRLGAVSQRVRSVFGGSAESDATDAGGDAEPEPAGGEEKIISVNVMAPEGTHFVGPALVEALEAAGLQHGEHGIFHRTLETRSGVIALYSVANIVKPGWFELERIDEFDTPGVVFFMQLPGPFDGLAAFEQMLQAARGVCGQLGGHLLDSRRCELTHQSIEHVREELLEYRRRAHLAARHARH